MSDPPTPDTRAQADFTDDAALVFGALEKQMVADSGLRAAAARLAANLLAAVDRARSSEPSPPDPAAARTAARALARALGAILLGLSRDDTNPAAPAGAATGLGDLCKPETPVQPESPTHRPRPPEAAPDLIVAREPEKPIGADEAVRRLTTGLFNTGISPEVHRPVAPTPPLVSREVDPPDLALVARRCAVKAEACRFAAERSRAIGQGSPFDLFRQDYAGLIERAKALPACYLWMIRRGEDHEPALLETAGRCYHNLGFCAALLAVVLDEPEKCSNLSARGAHLLAEAQSALMVSVQDVQPHKEDQDQRDAFIWLREWTAAERRFIERHMSRDDPAAPADWADVLARLERLRADVERQNLAARDRRNTLRKIAYHADRLASDPREANIQAAAVVGAVEYFLDTGGSPSSVELAETLRPALDLLPDDLEMAPAVRAVLEGLDQARLTDDSADEEVNPGRARSEEVLKAAELLRGKTVVLIGGQQRARHKARLEEALELGELRWIATEPHQASIDGFESEIAKPETAVVMVAIRWSRHSFEGVKEQCRKHGKHYVRLPAGYHPNQVAQQVLSQVSGRLGMPGK